MWQNCTGSSLRFLLTQGGDDGVQKRLCTSHGLITAQTGRALISEFDFPSLNAQLLNGARTILSSWFPNGKIQGHEFKVGNLAGDKGESLSVNLSTGVWADFAANESGGDLVSLYAAAHGISQGDAYKQLAGQEFPASPPPKTRQSAVEITKPPADAGLPPFTHPTMGKAVAHWCYRDESGEPIFYVSRHEQNGDRKQIFPWSWDGKASKWCMRAQPKPRPLYGLELLAARADARVCIVEGEKAAEAARQIMGSIYTVVTWPGGVKAVHHADWGPLTGRKILIWPDADEPGREAAKEISELLTPHCSEIKIIEPPDRQDGWDAADALAEGMDLGSLRRLVGGKVTITTKNTTTSSPPQVDLTPNIDNVVPAETLDQKRKGKAREAASSAMYQAWSDLGLQMGVTGAPVANVDNALRIMENLPAIKEKIWFDSFYQRFFTEWDGQRREWSDVDTLNLTAFIQRQIGIRSMKDPDVYKAVIVYGHRFVRDEPRDFIDSLTWDGVERISHFLTDALGAGDSEYMRAASRNFWIGLAARIYQPGCKLDTMILLEGEQGIKKSTALSVIGGPWYAEANESVTSKDFFMILSGKLLIEIADLDAFSKAEVTRTKQVISNRSDRFRAPYDRLAEDHPRRTVFAGTTNEANYLRDATGGRRFWPVKCGEIRLDIIEANRSQYFAEAREAYRAGEKWWIMPDAETTEMQETRRQHDEWEMVVDEFVRGRVVTTLHEVASQALHIDLANLDLGIQRRIGLCLRRAGWEKTVSRKHGGLSRKEWRPADLPDQQELPSQGPDESF